MSQYPEYSEFEPTAQSIQFNYTGDWTGEGWEGIIVYRDNGVWKFHTEDTYQTPPKFTDALFNYANSFYDLREEFGTNGLCELPSVATVEFWELYAKETTEKEQDRSSMAMLFRRLEQC